MVRLRLRRFGRTHRPYYRLAAMDGRTKRDGKAIEELGTYNPIEKDPDKQVQLNADRIRYWLSVGAMPSETAVGLLRRVGVEVPAWAIRTHGKRPEKPAEPAASA